MDGNKICGIVRNFDDIKNLVIADSDYKDTNTKEIIYSTIFGEVEALVGFESCNIAEYDMNDDYVEKARHFLCDSPNIQGIVFLENSAFMVIIDLIFFSASIQNANGTSSDYTELIETYTYDDEESSILISEDWRLA